jgi:hypothetical protein
VLNSTIRTIAARPPDEYMHRRKSTNPLARVFSNSDLDHDGSK